MDLMEATRRVRNLPRHLWMIQPPAQDDGDAPLLYGGRPLDVRVQMEAPVTMRADGTWVLRGTEIPLRSLIQGLQQGESAEAVASRSGVETADVYLLWGFYLRNKDGLDCVLLSGVGAAVGSGVLKPAESEFPVDLLGHLPRSRSRASLVEALLEERQEGRR